ncbi:MAG TPA: HAD-IB family phosphatase [Polyangiales bacterium]|nr:HAD-IB family phosphatase [Polyangiales bacterium]
MTETRAAAFFRIEGTLVSQGACTAAAYLAANAAGFAERAFKLGQVALTAPLYSLLGQSDRVLANRLAYLPLRNMSEDRIAELASEYFDGFVRDRVLQGGVDLMREARRKGQRVVLISDGLREVVEPIASHLRHVDDYICNRLEIRDGYATGKLLEPVVGGHDSAAWVRRYAAEHALDLASSVVYAAHGPDLLLMSAVGAACAVSPDFTLRRAARQADWPIVDYDV